LELRERYKIGTSELFEFVGTFEGEPIRGAGDSQHQTVLIKSEPQFALPAIYFHLGVEVIESMK